MWWSRGLASRVGQEKNFASIEQSMSEVRAYKNAKRDVKIVNMTAVSDTMDGMEY
jgi:hypothetical protein